MQPWITTTLEELTRAERVASERFTAAGIKHTDAEHELSAARDQFIIARDALKAFKEFTTTFQEGGGL